MVYKPTIETTIPGFFPQVHLPSKSGAGGLERGAVPLSGFDALKSDVPAAVRAAEDPEHRLLRPPHRTHLPNELPEDEQWRMGVTLWLCQNSYWKWPFIVDFPIKNGDFL